MMTIREMITEWRKGCSCAGPDHDRAFRLPDGSTSPVECADCTEALINAIEDRLPIDASDWQEWITRYCGKFDPETTAMRFSANEMRKAFEAGRNCPVKIGEVTVDLVVEPSAEVAKALIDAFRGGLIDVPDPANARGFTTRYLPIEAMQAALRAVIAGPDAAADMPLGQEVIDLVIAARELAFSDHRPVGSPETQAEVDLIELFDNLDKATEKFAEIVPWHDQPDDEPIRGEYVDDATGMIKTTTLR